MASGSRPKIHFDAPTSTDDVDAPGGDRRANEEKNASSRIHRLKHRTSRPPIQPNPSTDSVERGSNVYLGSYRQITPRGSFDLSGFGPSPPSPKPSVSRLRLERYLQAVDADLNTYGVEELRHGFFDASFYRPLFRDPANLQRRASTTLPQSFSKSHPLSIRHFLPQQLRAARQVWYQVTTTRAGVKLLKSFLGFFICYVVCLIPTARDWLGRQNYVMPVSAIINHAGRPVGSQIDGLVMTTLGTIAGLGWGSVALYVSTATPVAQAGYGGILATFLVMFTATIGWLRCVYLRFYQAVICAGFAMFYMCLADTSEAVSWRKVFNYGIPWALGQAVCLIIACCVLPDAGSRSLALRLHDSLNIIQQGLQLPHGDDRYLRRELTFQFVKLSTAVRDFTIEFSVSRYRPDDVRQVRNLIQAVIRSVLSIRPNTKLFGDSFEGEHANEEDEDLVPGPVRITGTNAAPLVRDHLQGPTRSLIDAMSHAITSADHVILYIGGQRKIAPALVPALECLRKAKRDFDDADEVLLDSPDLPSTYAKQPDVVNMLLFIHPVRQTADKVEAFVQKIVEMQHANRGWRVLAPSYPWWKATMRTNFQVRHDRGGLTAGFYFQSKKQLERIVSELQSTTYAPPVRPNNVNQRPQDMTVIGKYEHEKEMASRKNPDRSREQKFRYTTWKMLHRLQGFESRFALKVTIVTTLLSVPAWLDQSRHWWSVNESWWLVVIIWSQMHPRVGGNFQDLIVRSGCAALGAVWAGFAFAARGGDPYVMGAFAVIFMLPMMYRFTLSAHPRSGIVGCLSFTVVSLAAYTDQHQTPMVHIAWTRGLAFVTGVAAALVINWFLWPFVARHELRKSLASMMLHSGILYRAIISKYIYYREGQPPGPEEVVQSEMLEGRLREVFVRIRQLLEMTRHEMRLRAPFDPLPYSGLMAACEAFFEHLVRVRQSSLYFQPTLLPSTAAAPTAALTAVRRDAVAAILLNLYALALGLRTAQPIPKYLPSAAAARGRLLDRMARVEAELAARDRAANVAGDVAVADADATTAAAATPKQNKGHRRWADVYEYAYSGALTDIVAELQTMKRFCKEICGEVGWD